MALHVNDCEYSIVDLALHVWQIGCKSRGTSSSAHRSSIQPESQQRKDDPGKIHDAVFTRSGLFVIWSMHPVNAKWRWLFFFIFFNSFINRMV